MNKITMETNEDGKYKVITQPNGIIVKMLVAPSQAWKDKMKKQSDDAWEKGRAKREARAREKLIQNKMKEMAIAELEKENLL